MTKTVAVEWTTTQTTTYRKEFDAADWAELKDTASDDLSEFEEPENEIRFENERTIDYPEGDE